VTNSSPITHQRSLAIAEQHSESAQEP